jgi:hypothetical protein
MEWAKKNQENHVAFISLHFCPKWYEALYLGNQYKLMSRSTRLMLKLNGDGSAIVNPKNESFGASQDNIDLQKVDDQTAKSLWGGHPDLNGVMTCDLVTEFGSSEMDIYHLDLKFANGQITSYRIRGNGILKPMWANCE